MKKNNGGPGGNAGSESVTHTHNLQRRPHPRREWILARLRERQVLPVDVLRDETISAWGIHLNTWMGDLAALRGDARVRVAPNGRALVWQGEVRA